MLLACSSGITCLGTVGSAPNPALACATELFRAGTLEPRKIGAKGFEPRRGNTVMTGLVTVVAVELMPDPLLGLPACVIAGATPEDFGNCARKDCATNLLGRAAAPKNALWPSRWKKT